MISRKFVDASLNSLAENVSATTYCVITIFLGPAHCLKQVSLCVGTVKCQRYFEFNENTPFGEGYYVIFKRKFEMHTVPIKY